MNYRYIFYLKLVGDGGGFLLTKRDQKWYSNLVRNIGQRVSFFLFLSSNNKKESMNRFCGPFSITEI